MEAPAGAVLTPAEDGLRRLLSQLTTLGVDLDSFALSFGELTGLHLTEVRALRVLSDSTADITAGQLGARLRLSSGATTRLLDRLESAGYVARVRSTADRRAVFVRMTERAWTAAVRFFGPIGDGVVEAMRSEFTATELVTVGRFLGSAADAIRATAPPEGCHAVLP